MLPIRWTTKALDNLEELTEHIAEDSLWAAVDIFELIQNCVIPAATHPYLFRPGRVAGTREIVAHPNYIVVYEIIDGWVQVMGVVHARRHYPR
jgi:plasmid stabilization system protein ParE